MEKKLGQMKWNSLNSKKKQRLQQDASMEDASMSGENKARGQGANKAPGHRGQDRI